MVRRRDFLQRAAVVPFAPVAVSHVSSIASASSTIFRDSFEDDSPGESPDGWSHFANNSQQVVDQTASDGSHSFRMAGDSGGCWEATAYHACSVPNSGTITFSGAVKPTSEGEIGCHKKRGRLAIGTSGDSIYPEKNHRLLNFNPDGQIVGANGHEVGGYNVDEWNTYQITYERNGQTVSVSYRFNGEDRGETSYSAPSWEDDLSHLHLQSGDVAIYWDDFSVRTGNNNTETPTSDETDLRSISYGQTKPGEIDESDPTGYYGNYEPVTFSGSPGDVITITMTSDGDPRLILLNPDGNRVTRNDDHSSLSDYNSRIQEYELQSSGEYTIVATSFDDDATFTYELSLEQVSSGGDGGGGRNGAFSGRVVKPDGTAARSGRVRVYRGSDNELLVSTSIDSQGVFSFTSPEFRSIEDANTVNVLLSAGDWFDGYTLQGSSMSENQGVDWKVNKELLYGPRMAESDTGPLGQVSVWRSVGYPDSGVQVIWVEVTNTNRVDSPSDIGTSAYDLSSGSFSLAYDEDADLISRGRFTDIDHPREMSVLSVDTPYTESHPVEAYHPERTGAPLGGTSFVEFSDLVTTETEETVNEGAGKILGTVPGVSSLLNVGNTLEWAFGDPLQTSSSLGIENPRNINPNEMDTATLLWKSDDTTYEEASVVGVFPIKFTSDSSTTVDVRLEWKFESWTLGFGTGRGYFAEQFEIGPY